MKSQINQFRKILRKELPRLETEYGVDSMKLFGSFVRGKATPESDLDILVENPEDFGHRFRKLPDSIPFFTGQ
ncbi:MAG: nucleotidyltransferase domain-containing protein [Candidatus Marinimicrobia bacterium]|nr:nucleotidyltransferase domain-containing protein [Candidatus Neomarinimicrobiota bacterium]